MLLRAAFLGLLVASALGEGVSVTHLSLQQARSGFTHSCNHDAAYAGSLHVALSPLQAISSLEWKLSSASEFGQASEFCNLVNGEYQLNFRAKPGGSFKPSMADVAFSIKEDRTTVVQMKALPAGGEEVPDCVPHKNAAATTRTNSKGTQVRECKCNDHYSGDGAHCWPIDYCSVTPRLCHRNATCSSPEGQPVSCVCQATFTGTGAHCDPINYCANEPCDEHATCKSWKGQANCSCEENYVGTGFNCTRKPLCQTSANDCHQNATCSATPGGITCGCNAGFDGNGRFCDPQAVCVNNGGCPMNSTCANEDGLRVCSCDMGYEAIVAPTTAAAGGSVGFKCAGINRCVLQNGGCGDDAVCLKTGPGKRECKCKETFEMSFGECIPINYCKAGGGCDKNALCTPLEGLRSCQCNSGYSGSGVHCALTGGCGPAAAYARSVADPACEHFNTHPVLHSYQCAGGTSQVACKSGFNTTLGNCPGRVVLSACTEIDLCAANNGGCGDSSIVSCNRTGPGQMICSCKRGYKMNTKSGKCDLTDACRGGADCHKQASCNQTGPAMHTCKCGPGYTGNGKACTPINYCKQSSTTCGTAHDLHACTYVEPVPCNDGAVKGCNGATNTTLPGFSCSCKLSLGMELDASMAASAAFTAVHYNQSAVVGLSSPCIPIDHCAKGTNDCNKANGVCKYVSPNLHDCKCNTGFKGNGVSCSEIDKCVTNNGGCAAKPTGICSKTGPNTRTCACAKFYIGDGVNCDVVNMCQMHLYNESTRTRFNMKANGGCDKNADCMNIGAAGERVCSCKTGYEATVSSGCQPVNACKNNNGGCFAQSECKSTGPGTRKCLCPLGYTGESPDGFTGCIRTNYCKLASGNSTLKACAAAATCTPAYPRLVESTYWSNPAGSNVATQMDGTQMVAQAANIDEFEGKSAAGEIFSTCESICEESGAEWAADKENVSTFTFSNDDEARAAFQSVGVQCNTFVKAASSIFVPAYSTSADNVNHVCTYSLPEVNVVNVENNRMNRQGAIWRVGTKGLCRCSSKTLVQPINGLQFSCSCNEGYKGNGASCEERNPCSASEQSECGTSAGTKCTYTGPGRHSCSCITGYEGNPKVGCTPVDNCAKEPSVCGDHSDCSVEAPGEHSCLCESGYVESNPQFRSTTAPQGTVDCVPVDNCKINNGNCGTHTICNSTGPATHKCKCKAGYKLGSVLPDSRAPAAPGPAPADEVPEGVDVRVSIPEVSDGSTTVGRCTFKGPSRSIDASGGRADKLPGSPSTYVEGSYYAQYVAWPVIGVETPEKCAEMCDANPSCGAFHYYGAKDTWQHRTHCYLHKSGKMSPADLKDGRYRYAGECPKTKVGGARRLLSAEAGPAPIAPPLEYTISPTSNAPCPSGTSQVSTEAECHGAAVTATMAAGLSSGKGQVTCGTGAGRDYCPAGYAGGCIQHSVGNGIMWNGPVDGRPNPSRGYRVCVTAAPPTMVNSTLKATAGMPELAHNACMPINPCTTKDTNFVHDCPKDAHSKCVFLDANKFVCECVSGYFGSGKQCAAINPCLVSNGGCVNALCKNGSPGKSSCTCKPHYESKQASGKAVQSCSKVDYCKTNNGGCSNNSQCIEGKVLGAVKCICDEGFKKGPANTCVQINPCDDADGTLCGVNTLCQHTGPASHKCSCQRGYENSTTVKGCSPIDSCKKPTACPTLAVCNSTGPNTHTCACQTGYSTTQQTPRLKMLAVKRNESQVEFSLSELKKIIPDFQLGMKVSVSMGLQDSNHLWIKATCDAGAANGCPPGLENGPTGDRYYATTSSPIPSSEEWDGQHAVVRVDPSSANSVRVSKIESCEEIDLCEGPSKGNCAVNAQCTATGPGTRSCNCSRTGFEGDGVSSCEAIKACAKKNGGCGTSICTNTGPGTKTCSCPSGHKFGNTKTVDADLAEAAKAMKDTSPIEPSAPFCISINPCEQANGGCATAAKCSHTGPNERSCSCDLHFEGNGEVCSAVKYCKTQTVCSADAECSEIDNPVGSDVVSCACNAGYKGSGKSCEVINLCKPSDLKAKGPCNANATCAHNILTGVKCTCKQGFTGDGKVACTAIDRCDTATHGCDANSKCVFTGPGARDCPCVANYEASGSTCKPIDMCRLNHGCHALADCKHEGPGKRSCKCPAFYTGSGIGASGCTEIDVCGNNGGCSPKAACARTEVGVRSCTCNAHYTSLGDGKVCEQTNYCNFPAACDTNAKCVSFLGGKNCSCNSGFRGSGQTCTEIDYCEECVANTICQHNKSSGSTAKPQCLCKEGFEGDGKKLCTAINHCSKQGAIAPCGKNQGCLYRGPGAFDCECISGFYKKTSTAKECVAINPCLSQNGGCNEHATCANPSTGVATCTCKSDYWGDGKTCKSIVASDPGRHIVCNEFAHVVADDGKPEESEIRHYTCKCLPGYTGNGIDCTKMQ